MVNAIYYELSLQKKAWDKTIQDGLSNGVNVFGNLFLDSLKNVFFKKEDSINSLSSIKLKDSRGNTVWEKDLSNDQKLLFDKKFKSQKVRGLFFCLFIPLRINIKEVFLPLTHLRALKVNNLVHRVLFAMLDVLTLPIRLITILPRFIYNQKYNTLEKHELYQILRALGAPNAILKLGQVKLSLVGLNKNLNINLIELPK